MEPLYFPFTYIPDDISRTLSVFFKTVRVYQPSADGVPPDMQKWIARGPLRCVVPVEGIEDRLNDICRSCYDWARQHEGAMDPFLMKDDNIPYYEESSAYRIRTEIDRCVRKKTSAQMHNPANVIPAVSTENRPSDDESLFKAALFLKMAQDFDIRQAAISSDLQSLEIMQQNLFSTLQGHEDGPDLWPEQGNEDRRSGKTAGDERLEERLTAWTRFLSRDAEPSNLVVTSSRDVLIHLMEHVPAIRRVTRLSHDISLHDGISSADRKQEQYGLFFETLIREGPAEARSRFDHIVSEQNSDCLETGQAWLTVYIAEAVSPLDLFLQGIGGTEAQVISRQNDYEFNTAIALLEVA